MGLISYAQNLEDIVLWRALKDVSSGYYVDIGAYDPAEDSVTKLFYDLGWRGINVEPVRACYEKFCADRPRDINLNIAIAERPCILTLHKIANTGISTAIADIAARHAEAGWLPEPIEVPALSLRELMLDAKWNETHFLKIDVEGAEEAVLKGADFSKNRPWIIVVEATVPGTQVQTHHLWSGLLDKAGYKLVYFDGLNRFYLAEERSDLESRFEAPPNIFDDYTTMREIRIHTKLAQAEAQVNQLSVEAQSVERSRQADLRVREQTWAGEHSENQRLNQEIISARAEVTALEGRLSIAEQTSEDLRASAVDLQTAIDDGRAEIQRLGQELDGARGEVASLEERLSIAEQTSEDLRTIMIDLQAIIDEERAESRRLDLELQYAKRHVSPLEDRLSFAEETCEDLRATVASFEAALIRSPENAKSQIAEMTVRLNCKKDEREKVRQEVLDLTRRIHDLSEQLRKDKDQLGELASSRSAMLSSTSWRITAPLRKIKTASRVLYRNPGMFFPLVARNLLLNRLSIKQNVISSSSDMPMIPMPLFPSQEAGLPIGRPPIDAHLDQPVETINTESAEVSDNPLRLRFNARYREILGDLARQPC